MGGLISGAVEGVTGKGAANESKKTSKSARKLTDVQANLLKTQIPYIEELIKQGMPLLGQVGSTVKGAQDRANQYDPAQETERAMQAFDQASRDTLQSDLGDVNSGYTARGFAGTGSSDQMGDQKDVLARRAFQRGAFESTLKQGEFGKKSAAMVDANNELYRGIGATDPTGRASAVASGLGSASAGMQNISQNYGAQAASANPGALIPIVSNAVKGIKWPWQKKSGNAFSIDSSI